MKKGNSNRLAAKQRLELDALADLPDEQIDTTDMLEIRDWAEAKRGLFYRPVKKQLTLRIDADVIAWFKDHAAKGEGYQTQMNLALRNHMRRHARARKSG
ncbi:BrnA antitoxin family protein [soil metagenome]